MTDNPSDLMFAAAEMIRTQSWLLAEAEWKNAALDRENHELWVRILRLEDKLASIADEA